MLKRFVGVEQVLDECGVLFRLIEVGVLAGKNIVGSNASHLNLGEQVGALLAVTVVCPCPSVVSLDGFTGFDKGIQVVDRETLRRLEEFVDAFFVQLRLTFLLGCGRGLRTQFCLDGRRIDIVLPEDLLGDIGKAKIVGDIDVCGVIFVNVRKQIAQAAFVITDKDVTQQLASLVDSLQHFSIACKLVRQPRNGHSVAENHLIERLQQWQTGVLVLLVVEVDVLIDALNLRTVFLCPSADDAVIHFDLLLGEHLGEVIQAEHICDINNIQVLTEGTLNIGEMLCNRTFGYLGKRLHVVKEHGQVLVDDAVRDGRRLLFVGIHVLTVLVESRKVRRELTEVLDHPLLLGIRQEVGQMLLDEFLLEQIAIRAAILESGDDLFAEVLLDLHKTLVFGFGALADGSKGDIVFQCVERPR